MFPIAHWRLLWLFALVSVLFSATVGAAPVSAQTGTAGCTPLDIVVLIDQSNSQTTITDPTGQRVAAVRSLISALYAEAAYTCPGTLYRLGVIGFGSTAEALVSFAAPEGQIQVAAGEPYADWAARRDAASARVVPQMLRNAALRPPLEMADAMLATPAPADDSSRRQRLVILLTDGPPCPDAAVERFVPGIGDRPCSSVQWIVHSLTGNEPLLFDYVGANAAAGGFEFDYGLLDYLRGSQALSGSTEFHVVYFTPAMQLDSVSSLVEDAWQRVTSAQNGQYFSPRRINGDLAQLPVILDTLVGPYLSPRRELVLFSPSDAGCTGQFVIEPLIDSAALVTLTRTGAGLLPQIVPPPGVDASAAMQVLADANQEATQRVRLDNAPPGVWSVTAPGDCEALDVQVARYPLTPLWVAPEAITINPEAPYFSGAENAHVTVTLTNSFGSPVAVPPGLTLSGCGAFTSTSPMAQALLQQAGCFGFFAGEAGEFRSFYALPAPAAASYFVVLTLAVPSVDPVQAGQLLEVFRLELTYFAAG